MNSSTFCPNPLACVLASLARVKALAPAAAVLLVATGCTRYQAPRGAEAPAAFERYNGTWVLDADASDPVPQNPAPGVLISSSTTSITEKCSVRVRAGNWSYDRCRQHHRENTLPDSARASIHSELSSTRPERLTLEFTDRSLHISDAGPVSPLMLPLDGDARKLDHDYGDMDITAWLAWDGLIPFVELSIEDGGWVSDRYEVTPEGKLTVTRTIGHSVTPTEPLARFVYTRTDLLPS